MFFTAWVADLEPSPTPAVRHAVIAAVIAQATKVRNMAFPFSEVVLKGTSRPTGSVPRQHRHLGQRSVP